MKIVEIKESNIASGNKYVANNYQESGIWYNCDELGMSELFMVNKHQGQVTFMSFETHFIPDYKPDVVDVPKGPEVTEQINKNFALKMLHVALHGDKSKIKDI